MHPRTGRSVNSNKIGHPAKVFATWLKLVLQMCVRHFVQKVFQTSKDAILNSSSSVSCFIKLAQWFSNRDCDSGAS